MSRLGDGSYPKRVSKRQASTVREVQVAPAFPVLQPSPLALRRKHRLRRFRPHRPMPPIQKLQFIGREAILLCFHRWGIIDRQPVKSTGFDQLLGDNDLADGLGLGLSLRLCFPHEVHAGCELRHIIRTGIQVRHFPSGAVDQSVPDAAAHH